MADDTIVTAGEATRVARAAAGLVAVLKTDQRVQRAYEDLREQHGEPALFAIAESRSRFATAPLEFEYFVAKTLRLKYSWLPMSLLRGIAGIIEPGHSVITVESIMHGPRPGWADRDADRIWLQLRSKVSRLQYMTEFDPRARPLTAVPGSPGWFVEDPTKLSEWNVNRRRTLSKSIGGRQPKDDGYVERDVEWFYRAEIKDPPETIYVIAQSHQRAVGAMQANVNHSVVQNAIKRTKELLGKVPPVPTSAWVRLSADA